MTWTCSCSCNGNAQWLGVRGVYMGMACGFPGVWWMPVVGVRQGPRLRVPWLGIGMDAWETGKVGYARPSFVPSFKRRICVPIWFKRTIHVC